MFLLSFFVYWYARDTFVSVDTQATLSLIQTHCYSMMVFAASLKMFDYLSVFRGLNRLVVMIEMMIQELLNFAIVLAIYLATFTVSEYIAYDYKDEQAYTIGRGFFNRVFGLLSGDPLVFGHTDSGFVLGTIYVLTFLLLVPMVLMNLIVALLTAAYDDARNQSSDVLARRQYEKMNQSGQTKRRTIIFQNERGRTLKTLFTTAADDQYTFLDHFDQWLVTKVAKWWEQLQYWIDQRRADMAKLQRDKTAAFKLRSKDAVVLVSESQIKQLHSGRYNALVRRSSFHVAAAVAAAKQQEAAAAVAAAAPPGEPLVRRMSRRIDLAEVLSALRNKDNKS